MDLRLDEIWREMQISIWMDHLAGIYNSKSILIKNVRIITEDYLNNQDTFSIFIENGRISNIDHNITELANITINGEGRYVIPGLIDMHIHTNGSNSHHLLNLLHGVTTTREMGGFPWMLTRKNLIKENKFLGPRMIVAGNMLNYRPFYQFTRVVRTIEEIQIAIKEQVEAGYDLIKIWNHMPPDLLQAISIECKKKGIDLAGHIPNDVTIQQAVDFGFRTMEHFKGYIIDRGVVLTDEDYVKSTPTKDVWNCPTFIVFYFESLLYNEGITKLEMMPENGYISPYIRDEWKKELRRREKEVEEKERNVPLDHLILMKKIFSDLKAINSPYIIGTDFGGGYPLCLPGFGLLREIQFMHTTFDISYLELLRNSTKESSIVLRNEDLGDIKIGSYADLLIIDNDPRVKGISLNDKFDVITAGRYISVHERDELFSKLSDFNTMNCDTTEEEALEQCLNYYLDQHNRAMLKPTFVQIFSSYLQDKGKFKEAISIAEINLYLSGTYFDYYNIGELYEQQGNEEMAINMWEKSLELNPYFDYLKKKMKKPID